MAEAVVPGSGKERPIGFLGLMRNRNYGLLWWGQLVSELGNRFHWVAVSLWVYSATGSATAVSFAVSSMFIGGLFVGLWAGVIVDRFDRKKILIVSDLVRGVLVALIPELMKLDIWLVYADLALISVATAFFRPAMFAIIPTVVSRRDILPANSFFSAMDTGADIMGPALAGILAFRYGYAPLLYFDALTFIISALCLVGTSTSIRSEAAGTSPRQSMLAGISDGLRYVRRDRLQWQLFILIFPAYLVGSGLNALQTPLAKGVIGITDAEFGTFNSVWGIGFLVASLLVGWYGTRVKRSTLIVGGFFLGFASTAAMGLSSTLEMLFATAFAVGFANTLNYVGLTTLLMEQTPQAVIGRVMSTRQVALGAVRVISPLAFGALGDIVGVRQSIWLMASLGAIGTGAVVLASPALTGVDAIGRRAWAPPRIWQAVIGSANPEFDRVQQTRLNLATVGLAGIAWLGVAVRYPYQAVCLLLAVLGTAILGIFLKSRPWRSP